MSVEQAKIEIRGAALFDALEAELRVFQPTLAESELALCHLFGAMISGVCNTDAKAQDMMQRLGDQVLEAYEQTKQINAKKRSLDRVVLKLDS